MLQYGLLRRLPEFKPYPACTFNQTPVRTFLDMIQEHALSCDDMESMIDPIKDLDQAPHIKPLTEILGSCP